MQNALKLHIAHIVLKKALLNVGEIEEKVWHCLGWSGEALCKLFSFLCPLSALQRRITRPVTKVKSCRIWCAEL
jgi:hypothetical protein